MSRGPDKRPSGRGWMPDVNRLLGQHRHVVTSRAEAASLIDDAVDRAGWRADRTDNGHALTAALLGFWYSGRPVIITTNPELAAAAGVSVPTAAAFLSWALGDARVLMRLRTGTPAFRGRGPRRSVYVVIADDRDRRR